MILRFAFCLNDEYASYVRIPIVSIIDNHINYCNLEFHILSDGISKKNQDNLLSLEEGYNNVNIKIHIINDSNLKELKTGNWPIHTWYRILLPSIIPSEIDKILYLDVDTLVNHNLLELFNINITDKSIAGILDPQTFNKLTFLRCGYSQEKGYICAGVLLMNLDYWRKNNLADKIIKWAKLNDSKIKFPDQDAINYICSDSKIVLPFKYNFMYAYNQDFFIKDRKLKLELENAKKNPFIIHYCNPAPWYKEFNKNFMFELWQNYNKKLKKPVRRSYKSQGLLLWKIIIWRLIHFKFNLL